MGVAAAAAGEPETRPSRPKLTSRSGSWALSLYQLGGPPALTPATPSSIPNGWKYVYCASDTGDRALANAQTHMWDLTIPKCLNYCSDLGFTLAGVENEAECYCANSLSTSSGQGKQVSTLR